MFPRKKAGLVLPVVLLMLSACQSGIPVPVSDIGDRAQAGHHVVKKGDTLYSIAFRYGYDYKTLARLNGIKPPYTIFVDQRIRLGGPSRVSTPPGKSGTTAGAAKKPKPVAGSTGRTASTPPKRSSPGLSWQWPIAGEIIRGFSLTGDINKGVDIGGRPGSPVYAAAPGVVVYAGGNLRGYGKLVIVKHNDEFLSAYGNNQEIRVKEGDSVRQGQLVARVGTSASQEAMLHFEIRRFGKPENPLSYLPRRTEG